MTEISDFKVHKKDEGLNDLVNHPKHYELPNGVEVFDVISGSFGDEAIKGFCIGNVIKYVCRHERKNGIEDLRKAKWYLDKYLEIAEKK